MYYTISLLYYYCQQWFALTGSAFFDSQEEAVKQVVEFMDTYSLNMEDYETLMELSKYQVFTRHCIF